MADEKEGPFKVVQELSRDPRVPLRYRIVKVLKDGAPNFLQEVVPDAGTGETARTLCNLLNREQKRLEAERGNETPDAA